MESKIYRIYTQSQENLISLVKAYFNNATIYEGIGIFKGVFEKCSIIEIIENDKFLIKSNIIFLAHDIKKIYNQKSVLLTIQDISITYV